MKKLFENWRKHLNEEDYGIDAQPAPFGPEEDLLITMVEAFKESHPELNIGEIGYTDAGQFYVEFDGEKVGMPNSEEYLYRNLVKRTGEGTRNTPRRYGGSMDENTNEGTSKKQKAHDAREVDKKAWRKKADAIAKDLGWPNRARWDDEKQTYYIQNNDTQERGQDVPQPK